MVENIIPVRMFSMRLKKDKTPNAVYDGIVRMKETFTSAAAAESPEQVSRVAITSGQLQENIWIDKTTNNPRSSFQISSNFINWKMGLKKKYPRMMLKRQPLNSLALSVI